MLTEEPPPGVTKRDYMVKLIYDELVSLLGGEQKRTVWPDRDKPYVMLLLGLQGSGKTTTAAKIARFYLKRSYKAGLIAADTFRPGAKEQLKQLGDKLGAPVYTSDGNSVRISVDGVSYLKRQGCNLIIIDTTGRHKEEEELLREMAVMNREVGPDAVFLVLDGTIGQLAKPQAEAFSKVASIGFIVITKLDGTAKGGGAISATVATGAPIAFVGTGEGIDDLEVFDPPSFISRLLGLGDIKALAERVKDAQISEKRFEQIIGTGKLTLADFEYYIDSMDKMGSLAKFFSLLPGLSNVPPEMMRNAETDMRRWKTILNSMTKLEKVRPELLGASRVKRIAVGAGASTDEVKALLKRYETMKTQMKMIKRNRTLLRKLSSYKA
jgi:signal recognition particle subunit SRP54